MSIHPQFLIALILLDLGQSRTCAQSTSDQDTASIVKATRLTGMTVENRDGLKLGKLGNFAVDLNSGELKYAIVASGGFLGLHTRYHAVPPRLLSAATAKRNVLATPLSKPQWTSAPTFKLSNFKSLADPEVQEQIAEYYRSVPTPPQFAVRTNSNRHARLLATGRPAKNMELRLATDLIGKIIVNREGEKLGEISDVLVALNSNHRAMILFLAGKLFTDRERAFVVPLRDLHRTGKEFVLNADRDALNHAARFNQRAWEAALNSRTPSQVFEYPLRD